MKVIATLAVLALAANYASAECNNMCSGHGICGANDACTCYRNWRGNDCSERTCQFGIAFVDTAQGDLDHDGKILNFDGVSPVEVVTQWSPSGTFEGYFNFGNAEEAHSYMECSNKGLCDRASGECVCFEGYEGSSCQRTICPNSCSGHGVCRNIVDKTQTLSTSTATHAYQLWDGLKNQACVCDPGYSGVDCRERLCPKGADPLTDGMDYEVQTLDVSGSGSGGVYKLKYTDAFGEVWTTKDINFMVDSSADGEVAAALLAIPNSVIEGVTVTAIDSVVSAGNGRLFTIAFTHNAGDLIQISQTDSTVASGAFTFATTTPGTTTAEECSGRGLCDYDTGVCKCFRGYRLDDCSSQHALAFGAGQ